MSAPRTDDGKTAVLILAGGPDPEHEVSLDSARGIERALHGSERFSPVMHAFETIDEGHLQDLPGEVIWPALHGRFGEGGEMQRMLEADGRPFVGSGSEASAIAIDKSASKRIADECARELGLSTVRVSETVPFDPSRETMPLDVPFVVKPTHEGSTIGLHIVRSASDWNNAHEATARDRRDAMAEPFVAGRELTIGMIDRGEGLECLPMIEITPRGGLYDYEAKYQRDDTTYTLDPDVSQDVSREMRSLCGALTERILARDLCRVDFILDRDGIAWFLELNTMPGFTSHSLVPMACASREIGLDMNGLCELLVVRALGRSRANRKSRSV